MDLKQGEVKHLKNEIDNLDIDVTKTDDIEKANEKVADRIIKFLFDKK